MDIDDKSIQEEVKNAVDSASETSSTNESKDESSKEVKPIPQPEIKQEVEEKSNKANEQIENLNKALQIEREEKRKIKEQINDLLPLKETVGKMKDVFVPKEEIKEQLPPEYLTPSGLDQWWKEKQEQQKKESVEKEYSQQILNEVSSLQKEFNGESGKPLYKDEDVLNWQKENNKLYLTPREAFNEMKRNEIIDWEVKQRLSQNKDIKNVEKPGSSGEMKQPEEKKIFNDQELSQAIREAISNAESDI